jgi:mannose-6-phosphate isomerase-like protein (cupin superfamily)
MAIKVSRSEVMPEDSEVATTWRLVRRDGTTGIGVGIAAFKERRRDFEPVAHWEAHDVPEIHYVLSGEGVLLEEDEQIMLRAGDAAITPAGRRHSLWSTQAEPLVTIYVAVSPDANPGQSR